MKNFFQTVLGIACLALFMYTCHHDDFTHPIQHDQQQAQALRDIPEQVQTIQNRLDDQERNLGVRPGHETWPAQIVVGKRYTAYVDSTPPGYLDATIPALVNGTVEHDRDLPSAAAAQDGDCWFVKSDNLYKVLVLRQNCWRIVYGMSERF
jgi:hypothetical protein